MDKCNLSANLCSAHVWGMVSAQQIFTQEHQSQTSRSNGIRAAVRRDHGSRFPVPLRRRRLERLDAVVGLHLVREERLRRGEACAVEERSQEPRAGLGRRSKIPLSERGMRPSEESGKNERSAYCITIGAPLAFSTFFARPPASLRTWDCRFAKRAFGAGSPRAPSKSLRRQESRAWGSSPVRREHRRPGARYERPGGELSPLKMSKFT